MSAASERLAELRALQKTSPAKARLDELRAIQAAPAVQEPTLAEQGIGTLETIGAIGSAVLAEPVAGLVGIAGGLLPGEEGQASEFVERTQEALTFEPRTPEGRRQIQATAQALKPIADILQRAEQASGDLGYDVAGPIGGAIAATLPTALLEVTGLGLARKGKAIAKSVPDPELQKVVTAGEQLEVPVLTTDLFNPESKFAGVLQDVSESLGPIGTGATRTAQQQARKDVVTGLADELEIELDSPFADSIVKSLNTKNKKVLREAGEVRNKAVTSLNTFGDVPPTVINRTIDELAESQAALRKTANPTITKLLENYKDSFSEPVNFEQMKNFRTQVIKARNAFDKADDTSPRDTAQAIKSAIDKDMISFARKNDRQSAKDWLSSNRQFANEANLTKRTELKRILNSGETTPEQVLNILTRGRPSELNRLNNALTAKGKVSAQGAIIQKALQDAKFFTPDADPNPDAFANVLGKPNFQKATNVFFEGAAKDRLEGVTKLLNSTRRAQEATTTVRTGERLLAPAAGVAGVLGVSANPLIGVPAIALGTALVKAYDSRAFRNLMLKLKGTRPDSRQELNILEAASAIVSGALPAAIEEQQSEQQ